MGIDWNAVRFRPKCPWWTVLFGVLAVVAVVLGILGAGGLSTAFFVLASLLGLWTVNAWRLESPKLAAFSKRWWAVSACFLFLVFAYDFPRTVGISGYIETDALNLRLPEGGRVRSEFHAFEGLEVHGRNVTLATPEVILESVELPEPIQESLHSGPIQVNVSSLESSENRPRLHVVFVNAPAALIEWHLDGGDDGESFPLMMRRRKGYEHTLRSENGAALKRLDLRPRLIAENPEADLRANRIRLRIENCRVELRKGRHMASLELAPGQQAEIVFELRDSQEMVQIALEPDGNHKTLVQVYSQFPSSEPELATWEFPEVPTVVNAEVCRGTVMLGTDAHTLARGASEGNPGTQGSPVHISGATFRAFRLGPGGIGATLTGAPDQVVINGKELVGNWAVTLVTLPNLAAVVALLVWVSEKSGLLKRIGLGEDR